MYLVIVYFLQSCTSKYVKNKTNILVNGKETTSEKSEFEYPETKFLRKLVLLLLLGKNTLVSFNLTRLYLIISR